MRPRRRRKPERRTTAPFAALHLYERRRAKGFRTSSVHLAHNGVKIGHEPIDQIPRTRKQGPEISQKGHVMFRKIAIALVAASVLTAPVLAQNTAPGTGNISPTAPAAAATVNAVKADKAITKHRTVLRHHRHGAKMVKHARHGKYAHHMKHGKPLAAKHVSAKTTTRSGVN